nr:unnamed protein product [Digitaria exilis]
MESEAEGQWVLMATGRSPTNIAVIKYWGKRDEALILPVNDSVSVTLDPDHLSATTTVAVSPAFSADRMWLNGKEISLSGGRFQSCLREIRRRARDFEDEKKGIKIKKEDWEKLHTGIWKCMPQYLCSKQKETSSTSGMRDSVETSPLLQYRAQPCGEVEPLGRIPTEDVEALPAPPEIKIHDQKFKGDVSYFICSRLGAGPKVVTDESQVLLNSITGLPNGV